VDRHQGRARGVGEQRQLSRAVDLPRHVPLVLCAKPCCPLGKDLPETVQELLELIGTLVVQLDAALADATDTSPMTMVLPMLLMLCHG
jgi:hypothetical protein